MQLFVVLIAEVGLQIEASYSANGFDGAASSGRSGLQWLTGRGRKNDRERNFDKRCPYLSLPLHFHFIFLPGAIFWFPQNAHRELSVACSQRKEAAVTYM